jgi:hypothetical protein
MVLETLSVSYGKASAYLPVIDLLRNYFRTAIEDDERIRREKVKGRNASEIGVGRTSWMRGNSEDRRPRELRSIANLYNAIALRGGISLVLLVLFITAANIDKVVQVFGTRGALAGILFVTLGFGIG